MENGNTFNYRYSAKQNKEVESIRKKYLPKEISKLEELKELDARVQNAGMIQSLCIGIIGCLIFGIGMCMGLHVLAGPMWLAVVIGIAGGAVMLPAYPVFRHISRKTKAELAPRILELSDELLKG